MEGIEQGYNTLPSRIALLVHTHFDKLPTRSKPCIRPDGTREWIPMTGIVVVKGMVSGTVPKFKNSIFSFQHN